MMIQRNPRFELICALLLCCSAQGLLAQTPTTLDSDHIRFTPIEGEPTPAPLPSALVLTSPDTADDDHAAKRSFSFERVSDLRTETTSEETDRTHRLRMKRIQTKLQRLRILAKECKSRSQAQRAPAPESPTDASQPAPPPLDQPAPTEAPSTQQSDESIPLPPEEQQSDWRTAADAGETAPVAPVHLTATVDSLALANNLFAQGKIDMARPIYEKLLRSPQDPSDVTWTQYQLACCYRIDGNIKAATKLYRIVASAKDEDYWKARAHWWLDYLNRSQTILDRGQELRDKLETLKKETDELRKT